MSNTISGEMLNRIPGYYLVEGQDDKFDKFTCQIKGIIKKYESPFSLKLPGGNKRTPEPSEDIIITSYLDNIIKFGIYNIVLDNGSNYDIMLFDDNDLALRIAFLEKIKIEFNVNLKRNTILSYKVLNEDNSINETYKELVSALTQNHNVFFNSNEIRTIKFEDEFFQCKNHKYFKIIEYMINNIGEEITLLEIDNAHEPRDIKKTEEIINGHTIDYSDSIDDTRKYIMEYEEELEKLKDNFEEADLLKDDERMLYIDNQREIIEKEIRDKYFELSHKPKNISPERTKASGRIRTALNEFYSILANNNLESTYLHFKRSIKVDNGCKYDPEYKINWYTG